MTPELFIEIALAPALRLLPSGMDTSEARAMILAICLHESQLVYRRQVGGPALGYPQFELGGVTGVLNHKASSGHARTVCALLDYAPEADVVYTAIAHNDILACVFARLLLWTLPQPLPVRNNPAEAWAQYMSAWRPGKPHRHTWDENYERAWEVVT